MKLDRIIGNSLAIVKSSLAVFLSSSVRTDLMWVCRLSQRTGLHGNLSELKEQFPGRERVRIGEESTVWFERPLDAIATFRCG